MVQPYDGLRPTKTQHPCDVCGVRPPSDDMYDILVQQRQPRKNRSSNRSTVGKYLPPYRYTIDHLYICNDCAPKVLAVIERMKVMRND